MTLFSVFVSSKTGRPRLEINTDYHNTFFRFTGVGQYRQLWDLSLGAT